MKTIMQLNQKHAKETVCWIFLAALISSCQAEGALADTRPIPELVNLVPEEIYIPPGFDDNDRAQVVVSGSYPNTCYKAAPARAQIDAAKKKITIENSAYFYSTGWCLQVLVPYSITVELGVLAAGTWDISAADNRGSVSQLGKINIAKASNPGPDDFLYAAVRDAYVEKTESGPNLVIEGSFGNDCMSLKEVKVLNRAPNVIEVFPMAQIRENTICKQIPRPFRAEVSLDGTRTGSVLIHVRSLNGQAVNKVVEF